MRLLLYRNDPMPFKHTVVCGRVLDINRLNIKEVDEGSLSHEALVFRRRSTRNRHTVTEMGLNKDRISPLVHLCVHVNFGEMG